MAQHCFDNNVASAVFVNGEFAFIEKALLDQNDHIILFIKNITFAKYSHLRPNYMKVGDDVVFYGNAKSRGLSFRTGVVAKLYIANDGECAKQCTDYSFAVSPGDSGGGIFNHGNLVGILTGVNLYNGECCYTPAYSRRILFTPKQLKEIYTYGR